MKLSTATRAQLKRIREIAEPPPTKPATPKATPTRRIVDRMVSAYMSYIKDNPGGTDGR